MQLQDIELNFDIKWNKKLYKEDYNGLLYKFLNLIGKEIDIYEIIKEINNNPNISYCRLKTPLPISNENSGWVIENESIKLNDNRYPAFNTESWGDIL